MNEQQRITSGMLQYLYPTFEWSSQLQPCELGARSHRLQRHEYKALNTSCIRTQQQNESPTDQLHSINLWHIHTYLQHTIQ